MNEFTESIISELTDNDNACVFSYDVDTDLVCIILNVVRYKQGCYVILNFDNGESRPLDTKFYMCGDELIAFSSKSVKEALHEVFMERNIPESLFNEIFLFMGSKSPLNMVLRNPYF